jgi:hypothetical protein
MRVFEVLFCRSQAGEHTDRRKGNVNPSRPRPPASGRCANCSGAGLGKRCPQQWPVKSRVARPCGKESMVAMVWCLVSLVA